MPKVDTFCFSIRDKTRSWIRVNINYAATRREFSAYLPEFIAATLHRDEQVSASTQYKLEEMLQEIEKQYGEAVQKRRKVIFYRFLSQIRDQPFRGDNGACITDGEMCSRGVALDLWYETGYVIDNPTEHWLICTDLNGERIPFLDTMDRSNRNSEWYMDYTKDREQFFAAFREYLSNSIIKMREFFCESRVCSPTD